MTATESHSNDPSDPAPTSSLPSFFPVAIAFAAREFRTLLRNRFLQVFFLIALAGGFASTGLTPTIEAIPFILLQLTLYLVPLFSILIGLSSAHGELEEHPFLFSQPVSRFALVTGKAFALAISLGAILFFAFLSGLIFSPRTGALLLLWGMSLLLAGVFVSLGLAIGCTTRERSRGIIYALLAWLFLLIGFDLIAYGAALTPFVQQQPLLWLGILLMNPVDAVRVAMLFHLEDIPFTVRTDLRLATFWMDHLVVWVLILCSAWISILLLWSRWRLNRREF
ncbi:MAG: ABC transporter permease subunit [Opitutales bacterium]